MTTPSSARAGLSSRWVLGVFLLSLLAAMGGAVYVYARFVQYDKIAARHLPPDTRVAARIFVEHRHLLLPARSHLLPLLEQVGRSPGAASPRSRVDRLQERLGVELVRDLRELVVGLGPTASDWVVVLAGKYGALPVAGGLVAVMNAEGLGWSALPDGLACDPRGPCVGQAADGAVVIGSSAERVRAALVPQDTAARLGLREDAALALAVGSAPWQRYAPPSLVREAEALPALRSIRSLTAAGQLAKSSLDLSVDVQLDAGADAAATAQALERLCGAAQPLGCPAAARFAVLEPTRLHAQFPYPFETLASQLEQLAARAGAPFN